MQSTEEIAYKLWEKAGRPEGCEEYYWQLAERIDWRAQVKIHLFDVLEERDHGK